MIRILALLLLRSRLRAPPMPRRSTTRDGFWSEWSDATFAQGRAREEIRDHVAAVLVVPLVPRDEPRDLGQRAKCAASSRTSSSRFMSIRTAGRISRSATSAGAGPPPSSSRLTAPRSSSCAASIRRSSSYPILTATIEDPSPVGLSRRRRRRARAHAGDRADGRAARRNPRPSSIRPGTRQYGGWSKSKFVDGHDADLGAAARAAGRRR